MKKFIALILTFVFLFSMASCRKKEVEITTTLSQVSSTAVLTVISSENITEGTSETESVTNSSNPETTQKRSAAAASTKKKKTTVASTLKTIVTELTESISTTAKRKKKTTTRRNYFPETTSAVNSTITTTETTTLTTTETETQTTEPESEAKEDEIPIYRPVQRPSSTTVPKKNFCTISINCAEIMKNKDKLKSGKEAFVPSDGEILKTVTVEFEDGETVFDVLDRICKNNTCSDGCQYCRNGGIQLEYEYTPGYENYYIEGIHQIYEKDCGSKSGWMYKVNGVFPNYGCSEYILNDGDKIEFIYTCDLGEDIGAEL